MSISTASRALNGGKPVSDELNLRVRRAAARVGYVSHVAASAMRGRNGLLAILTDELGAGALAELTIAAGRAATAAELTTTVSSAGPRPEQQLLALQVLRSLRPQAIVLTGGWVSDQAIRPALERELKDFVHEEDGHVVILGPAVLPYPTVSFDDFEDGRLVAAQMASRGARSALILAGPASNESFRARMSGMVSGLRDAGLTEVRTLHTPDESADAEAVVVREMTASVAEMILCVNDRLALGAYAALDGLGLRIPDDVTLSGMDDLPVSAVLEPGLTTVRHPLTEAGALVVELALSTPSPDFRTRLPGALVVRGSTGA